MGMGCRETDSQIHLAQAYTACGEGKAPVVTVFSLSTALPHWGQPGSRGNSPLPLPCRAACLRCCHRREGEEVPRAKDTREPLPWVASPRVPQPEAASWSRGEFPHSPTAACLRLAAAEASSHGKVRGREFPLAPQGCLGWETQAGGNPLRGRLLQGELAPGQGVPQPPVAGQQGLGAYAGESIKDGPTWPAGWETYSTTPPPPTHTYTHLQELAG